MTFRTQNLRMDKPISLLILALILLVLTSVLFYREKTTPKKPVQIEYKFYNLNI